jgi:flagellar protein FliO/FliZ
MIRQPVAVLLFSAALMSVAGVAIAVPDTAPLQAAETVPMSAPALPTPTSPASPVMTPVAPPAATGPSPTGFAGSMQMLFALLVVLGLLFSVAWLLKRFGPVRTLNNATVKIVGGISVGNRERIVVVEVADQWIVVGVAPGRINTLSTMPKQDTTINADVDAIPPVQNFALWLKKTIDKRNGNGNGN